MKEQSNKYIYKLLINNVEKAWRQSISHTRYKSKKKIFH